MSAVKKQKTEGAQSHGALKGAKHDLVKVARALVSVSDKTELLELGKTLAKHGVQILSTGGTAKKLADNGIPVTEVGDFTKFPEILNGRVKTLHPMIHGGLLAVRGNDTHAAEMKEHGIQNIDMVVCNLYPFQQTVAKGADFDTCVENIDIGGPSMVRSAAKNHRSVAIITDPSQYKEVIESLDANAGQLPYAIRRKLAADAFKRTSEYDTAISAWFAEQV